MWRPTERPNEVVDGTRRYMPRKTQQSKLKQARDIFATKFLQRFKRAAGSKPAFDKVDDEQKILEPVLLVSLQAAVERLSTVPDASFEEAVLTLVPQLPQLESKRKSFFASAAGTGGAVRLKICDLLCYCYLKRDLCGHLSNP